jgi:hypothetical protein
VSSASGQADSVGNTEARWPIILVIGAVSVMVEALPNRYELAPSWLTWTMVSIVFASMLAVALAPASATWHRVQRLIVITVSTIISVANVLAISRLVADMLTHVRGYSGITLLESGIVIWTANIVAFALLYWQLDRTGPEARAAGVRGPGDFHFAETDAREGSAWQPRFMDYLYLTFTASTSFTPPDYARPTSRRVKLILLLQSLISLTTLFLIAARAIATLT